MFSGHKAHASFALTPTTRAAFEAELTHYRTGKGTIALPYNTTPPLPLLTRMIKYRVREHEDDGVNWNRGRLLEAVVRDPRGRDTSQPQLRRATQLPFDHAERSWEILCRGGLTRTCRPPDQRRMVSAPVGQC